MRSIALFLLIIPLLWARPNPFEPVEQEAAESILMPPKQLDEKRVKLPSSARVLKSITFTHQDMDGSIGATSINIDRQIDWHAEIRVDQPDAGLLTRTLGAYTAVEDIALEQNLFFIAGDVIKMKTSDGLIRSFFLPRPSRIVMDFNNSLQFEAHSAKLDGDYFTEIDVSFHETFYRVIVTLDSFYPYSIEAVSDGYLLGLN
ncbi:MAG: AMIN domain-containing protein [Helicobacteraceae bacterium]|jgi:hypothetical protein|nr:AMIN domain-containing protein [Helicobacteraceae bacterium]